MNRTNSVAALLALVLLGTNLSMSPSFQDRGRVDTGFVLEAGDHNVLDLLNSVLGPMQPFPTLTTALAAVLAAPELSPAQDSVPFSGQGAEHRIQEVEDTTSK